MENKIEEYTPFEKEWEAEMMKWRKLDIISFLKKQLLKLKTESAPDNKWISVKEPPKVSGLVLISVEPVGDVYVSFYRPDRRVFEVWGAGRDPILDMKATHWQPLPDVPEIYRVE